MDGLLTVPAMTAATPFLHPRRRREYEVSIEKGADMTGRSDDLSQAAEGDRLDQRRDPWEEPRDPERTTGQPAPEGVEANPADVVEQTIEVPDDDEDERSEL